MNWINEVNSTNLKIVTGCVGFLLLIAGVIVMEFTGTHFNEILFLECAGLVTAWASVSYMQFAKKRETTIVTPPQVTAENAEPPQTQRAPMRRIVLDEEGMVAASHAYTTGEVPPVASDGAVG